MPTERLSMRQVREVLRLRWGLKLNARATARSVGIGRTTVQDYVRRAGAAKLSWPLAEGMNDEKLEALLFPAPLPKGTERSEPDWAEVHKEMKKKKGMTILLVFLRPRVNGHEV